MATSSVPESYSGLPWKVIAVANHPPNAPGATPVMVVTLNRPKQHNALTGELAWELIKAFELFDIDDRVKAIIVTGAGRTFCAGADLSVGLLAEQPGETTRTHRDAGGTLALAIHHCRKPIIGALQGSAVGVGITMTLPMAIRVTTEKAKIGFVFARRGLVMEACSSYFLPKLIGMSKALYLTTTGSVLPVTDPALRDLFADIVPSPQDVLPRAIEIANEIANNTSTISTYLMREMMYRNPGTAEGTHLLDSEVIYSRYGSSDKDEGINSFLEKRPVNFTTSVNTDLPSCVPWWTHPDVSTREPKASKL